MKILILVITLCLVGCNKVHHYELEVLAEICGGYQEIKRVWRDVTIVKAECKSDNKLVTVED